MKLWIFKGQYSSLTIGRPLYWMWSPRSVSSSVFHNYLCSLWKSTYVNAQIPSYFVQAIVGVCSYEWTSPGFGLLCMMLKNKLKVNIRGVFRVLHNLYSYIHMLGYHICQKCCIAGMDTDNVVPWFFFKLWFMTYVWHIDACYCTICVWCPPPNPRGECSEGKTEVTFWFYSDAQVVAKEKLVYSREELQDSYIDYQVCRNCSTIWILCEELARRPHLVEHSTPGEWRNSLNSTQPRCLHYQNMLNYSSFCVSCNCCFTYFLSC